jgi:3-phenylpropionate/cinnamic acid dioxygenase small subunit
MSDISLAMAHDLLCKEAKLLDQKKWIEWLGLYEPQATYWAPAWLNEYDLVTDPDTQVSLIYHTSRDQLAERIARIQSRKSITALPLPRTAHLVSNIQISKAHATCVDVTATFAVHVYDPRTTREHCHFGHYEYRLSDASASPMIAAKRVALANDRIPTIIDFYTL